MSNQPLTDELLRAVAKSETYQQLVRERSRFAWSLTAAMLAIYFSYVMLIAFNPALLARPIAGRTTTLGIPLGLGVILTGIALTWAYVRRANRRFDALTAAIIAEAGR